MSQYPVGATWEATDSTGTVGKVWLRERNGNFEHWRYSVGSKEDWCPSRTTAVELCNLWLEEKCRFKRKE